MFAVVYTEMNIVFVRERYDWYRVVVPVVVPCRIASSITFRRVSFFDYPLRIKNTLLFCDKCHRIPTVRLFSFSPAPPKFFWKISENIIKRFEYKPKSFSFKLILKVIVKDSDTNFVHTFSPSSHAVLMKKSTASCFKSSIDT